MTLFQIVMVAIMSVGFTVILGFSTAFIIEAVRGTRNVVKPAAKKQEKNKNKEEMDIRAMLAQLEAETANQTETEAVKEEVVEPTLVETVNVAEVEEPIVVEEPVVETVEAPVEVTEVVETAAIEEPAAQEDAVAVENNVEVAEEQEVVTEPALAEETVETAETEEPTETVETEEAEVTNAEEVVEVSEESNVETAENVEENNEETAETVEETAKAEEIVEETTANNAEETVSEEQEIVAEPVEVVETEEPVEIIIEDSTEEKDEGPKTIIIETITTETIGTDFDYNSRLEKIEQSKNKLNKDLHKTKNAITKYERTARRRARNQKMLDRRAVELTNLNLMMYSVTDIKNVDADKKTKQEELTTHIAELKSSIQDADAFLDKNKERYEHDKKMFAFYTKEAARYDDEIKELKELIKNANTVTGSTTTTTTTEQ